MSQSPLNKSLNSQAQEFSRACVIVPRIDWKAEPQITCSPAVLQRNGTCKLYTPRKSTQSILRQLGLWDLKEREPDGSKGVFAQLNALGMTTAFFRDEEEEKKVKNELEDEYIFIPDFSLSLPTRIPLNSTSLSQRKWPSASGIPLAHKQGIKGRGVLVGVLDTGIDADHQEFSGRSITYRYISFDPSHPQSLPRDVRGFDPGGHGTHVCGIIAGNSLGIAPEADLYVASVIESESARTSFKRIISGLEWLLHHFSLPENKGKPAVLNMSICFSSSPLPEGIPSIAAFQHLLKDLREGIVNILVQAKVLPVVSIGNEGSGNFTYPGAFKQVLGVGAVDFEGKLADFSGSGIPLEEASKPDLVGYGVDVYSSLERDYTGQSVYKHMSGTSMAAPYVAGIAALYRCQNPLLTVDEVKTKIIKNAYKLDDQLSEHVGAGLVRFVTDDGNSL